MGRTKNVQELTAMVYTNLSLRGSLFESPFSYVDIIKKKTKQDKEEEDGIHNPKIKSVPQEAC